MSGKASRQKGDRTERLIVKTLTEASIEAKRVLLSGSANGYPGDISADIPGLGEVILEIKSRKSSPLYNWLEDRDGLILKADGGKPMIVLMLEAFLKLIKHP